MRFPGGGRKQTDRRPEKRRGWPRSRRTQRQPGSQLDTIAVDQALVTDVSTGPGRSDVPQVGAQPSDVPDGAGPTVTWRDRWTVRRRRLISRIPSVSIGSLALALVASALLSVVAYQLRAALPVWYLVISGLVSTLALTVLVVRIGRALRRHRRLPPEPPAQPPSPAPQPPSELDRPAIGRAPRPLPAARQPICVPVLPHVRPLTIGAEHYRTPSVRLPEAQQISARYESSFFGGRVAGWPVEVRGACLRGPSHARAGEPGQDTVGLSWSPERQRLLLLVADGLGRRRQSHKSSAGAVRSAIRLWSTAPVALSELVYLVADELHGASLDGATTLVVAELRRERSGILADVAAVGDSEVWCLAHGRWKVIHHARGHEGTYVLPRQPDKVALAQHLLPPDSVLVLGTDGFASALSESSEPLPDALTELWSAPPEPLEFVNHVSFRDDHFQDDRGVIAAWIAPD